MLLWLPNNAIVRVPHPIAGFTLLEILVVLALLGILTGIGLNALDTRRFEVQRASSDLQAVIQAGRFESIKRNQPVLVTFGANKVQVCVWTSGTGTTCPTSPAPLRTWETSSYKTGLTLTATPSGATLRWQPDGLPTKADGNVLPSETKVTLTLGHQERVFTINNAGKVAQ